MATTDDKFGEAYYQMKGVVNLASELLVAIGMRTGIGRHNAAVIMYTLYKAELDDVAEVMADDARKADIDTVLDDARKKANDGT